MGRIRNLLSSLFPNRRRQDYSNVEQLRISFTSRYHHFKLLLSANRSSLEIMAEMDEAMTGVQPFGMTFIRSRCTRVLTHVFQIIKHLDELAPGKYGAR